MKLVVSNVLNGHIHRDLKPDLKMTISSNNIKMSVREQKESLKDKTGFKI